MHKVARVYLIPTVLHENRVDPSVILYYYYTAKVYCIYASVKYIQRNYTADDMRKYDKRIGCHQLKLRPNENLRMDFQKKNEHTNNYYLNQNYYKSIQIV